MTASMTGFAAQTFSLGAANVAIDLRSVNQRFLETHFRLAEEFRALEPRIRELIGQRLSRGKVECRISLAALPAASEDNGLNPLILERLQQWQDEVRQRFPSAPVMGVAEILRWPGLLQGSSLPIESLNQRALEAVQQALDDLVDARRREGETLRQYILTRLDAAEQQIDSLKPLLPTLVATQREKLASRLREALGEPGHERLAQEVALFAQKVDIDEEVSRFHSHIGEVRRILGQSGPVGKRLDFLMQELHREANTMGSKSVTLETSRVSLELKVLIEQMREQVQNIE
jgi:uncharacterized protein (TIGR00255 family)